MATLSLIGLMAAFVSHFNLTAARPLIWIVERVEWFMVHSVDPFSRAGLASLRLPHYHGGAVVVYFVYFALLLVLVWALARWNPLRPASIAPPLFRPVYLRITAVAFVVTLAVVLLHPFSAGGADGKLHVVRVAR
jgi:hypothetical protein